MPLTFYRFLFVSLLACVSARADPALIWTGDTTETFFGGSSYAAPFYNADTGIGPAYIFGGFDVEESSGEYTRAFTVTSGGEFQLSGSMASQSSTTSCYPTGCYDFHEAPLTGSISDIFQIENSSGSVFSLSPFTLGSQPSTCVPATAYLDPTGTVCSAQLNISNSTSGVVNLDPGDYTLTIQYDVSYQRLGDNNETSGNVAASLTPADPSDPPMVTATPEPRWLSLPLLAFGALLLRRRPVTG